jgi:hypothetical protein
VPAFQVKSALPQRTDIIGSIREFRKVPTTEVVVSKKMKVKPGTPCAIFADIT